MFRKLLDEGRAATTSAPCCAAPRRKRSSAVRCWPSRAAITPHTNFTAQVYVLNEGRGRAVTRRSSPTTTRSSTSAPPTSPARIALRGGRRDGDARRQHRVMTVRAPEADRHGRGPAVSPSVRVGAPSVPASSPSRQDAIVAIARAESGSERHEYQWQIPRVRRSGSGSRPTTTRSSTSRRRRSSRRSCATQAKVRGPGAAPDRDPPLLRGALAARRQGLARALRDADPQAPARHRRADAARRSSRSSASTSPPASTSRSRSRPRNALRESIPYYAERNTGSSAQATPADPAAEPVDGIAGSSVA